MNKKIYSTRCWIDGRLQAAMIQIEKGQITAISPFPDAEAEDLGDRVVMPGVADAHAHINEPGRTDWEGFETATAAAAAGGVTLIADMPLNSSPTTIDIAALRQKQAAAAGKTRVHVVFYGGLVPGNTAALPDLIDAGVPGIKCFLTHSGIDEFPNVEEADLEAAMPLLAARNIPLLAHCEWEKAAPAPDWSAYPKSYRHYLASRPKAWENEAVALMIRLCRRYRTPVHIVHVASDEALPLIAEAKAEGLPLTAETCPHYLLFDAESIPDANTLYKCAPPIREKANNERLKEALANGVLDFIASDHSPAPPEIKALDSGNLRQAWGGIAGLQFLLPAAWTALRGSMSLETFIPLATENPVKFLHLAHRKGRIAPGYDADLCIWNPEASHTIQTEDIRFRHKISPYVGQTLFGVVERTLVGGQTA